MLTLSTANTSFNPKLCGRRLPMAAVPTLIIPTISNCKETMSFSSTVTALWHWEELRKRTSVLVGFDLKCKVVDLLSNFAYARIRWHTMECQGALVCIRLAGTRGCSSLFSGWKDQTVPNHSKHIIKSYEFSGIIVANPDPLPQGAMPCASHRMLVLRTAAFPFWKHRYLGVLRSNARGLRWSRKQGINGAEDCRDLGIDNLRKMYWISILIDTVNR